MHSLHSEIDVEVPYIDMVEVRYNHNVGFIDQPGSFKRDRADTL